MDELQLKVKKVVQLRQDGETLIIHSRKNLRSAETTLALRSLQMGRSWLGKHKGELGEATPYKVVDNVKDIPKTADTPPDYKRLLPFGDFDSTELSALEFTNRMREVIEQMILQIDELDQTVAVKHSLQHYAEAKMWLGYELARLREA